MDGHALTLGGSIGVEIYLDHSAHLCALMLLADRAMYQVKGRSGRRVAMAGGL